MTQDDLLTTELCAGVVDRITFFSEQTGFAVLRIKVRGQRDLATVTGNVPAIQVGEQVSCRGSWVNDKQYGRQFKATEIDVLQPNTLEGIRKYLGSGLIKGIGPAFAKTLVDGFGEAVLDVIEREPERLLSLEGIGQKRVDTIKAAWQTQKSVRDIMLFLQSHGVGTTRAFRIYKTYKEKAIEKIKVNPYCLAVDIWGIGFKTADELAMRLGVPHDALQRVSAGVLHVMRELVSRGDCFVLRDNLIQHVMSLLSVDEVVVDEAIAHEVREKRCIAEEYEGDVCYYISSLFLAEQGVAHAVKRLVSHAHLPWQLDDVTVPSIMQQGQSITLSPSQVAAVNTVLRNKFSCITGGPGVGKTTIMRCIIDMLRSQDVRITLCAPTGRAAKRLSESTGMPAKTIHRLLEFDPSERAFVKDQDQPMDTDLLIIDEASMVDIVLMNSLLKAVPDTAAVIVVGDVDQLPSVGPGAVLQDLIQSGQVAVARLTEIHRQAASSQIIANAHAINAGEFIGSASQGEDGDFYYIESASPELILRTIKTVVAERIPNKFNFDPIADIQVLSPMNRGALGVQSLNIEMQKLLNPTPLTSVTKFGWTFGVGDKVIQTINNYDKEVFNGDIGVVHQVNAADSALTVLFDGRRVMYDYSELDELSLAYAISIHKSQGSEYPVVVMPLAMQHYMLLQRNLLYTGVTRGKRLVVLVGERKAVSTAIRNNQQSQRLTKLDVTIQVLLCRDE